MEVQFVASVAPIVRDVAAAHAFYHDALGLTFEGGGGGGYAYTQRLEGAKHLGLWPLSEAATACFGTTEWPAEIPIPQASIEGRPAPHRRCQETDLRRRARRAPDHGRTTLDGSARRR